MTISVIHISTSNHGGAAVAAQQISNKMGSFGVKSTLISRENFRDFDYGTVPRIARVLIGKVVSGYQRANAIAPFGTTTPISISNIDSRRIIRHNFDIVHVHNWYNFFNINDMINLSREIPLVFTFHDERLITGGCHTTLGCKKFISGCNFCPAVRQNIRSITKSKAEIDAFFSTSRNINVISPSQWMINQINLSGLSANLSSLTLIPNIIAPDFLTPPKLPPTTREVCKLLFIAADISIDLKGLSLLIRALNIISNEADLMNTSNIELHLVGGGKIPFEVNQGISVIHHGFQGKSAIKQLISESTFLVVPSLSENSPNVIAEAQLLGLPVIASNVGGIPELIEDFVTGFLTPIDPHLMAACLQRAFSYQALPLISSRARQVALKRHNPDLIAESHLSVYRRALAIK